MNALVIVSLDRLSLEHSDILEYWCLLGKFWNKICKVMSTAYDKCDLKDKYANTQLFVYFIFNLFL